MDSLKIYRETIDNIKEFMDEEMVKVALRDKYGYDEKYLLNLGWVDAVKELAARMTEAIPGCDVKFPVTEVSLPNGATIRRDGKIERNPIVELAHVYGYDPKKLAKMDPYDVYELWCEKTGEPLGKNYDKKKAKAREKQKEGLVKLGFSALEDDLL